MKTVVSASVDINLQLEEFRRKNRQTPFPPKLNHDYHMRVESVAITIIKTPFHIGGKQQQQQHQNRFPAKADTSLV